jgi:hypothetical protein
MFLFLGINIVITHYEYLIVFSMRVQAYKDIEPNLISIYPRNMKKIICILLMCWLPLSMVTAQAMSTKMMLQNQQDSDSTLRSQGAESCHGETHTQKDKTSKSHKCTVCGSCVLASSVATFSSIESGITFLKTALKHLAFEPTFVSIELIS